MNEDMKTMHTDQLEHKLLMIQVEKAQIELDRMKADVPTLPSKEEDCVRIVVPSPSDIASVAMTVRTLRSDVSRNCMFNSMHAAEDAFAFIAKTPGYKIVRDVEEPVVEEVSGQDDYGVNLARKRINYMRAAGTRESMPSSLAEPAKAIAEMLNADVFEVHCALFELELKGYRISRA